MVSYIKNVKKIEVLNMTLLINSKVYLLHLIQFMTIMTILIPRR